MLTHIRHLARNTQLLPHCYRSPDVNTQRKTFRHFKELENFIRERECWAIAPADTTLEDLRKDFKDLALIFITGNYGLFKWQDTGAELAPPLPRWKSAPAVTLRVVGAVFPLALMGAYLWKAELFPHVNIDKNILGFIFVSWLLLTIDAGLKLGVVSQLTSIAKGIKDLS